jgi:sulfotransferase family protein
LPSGSLSDPSHAVVSDVKRVPLLQLAVQGTLRTAVVRCLSGALPIYVVNEFPRSGGRWISWMLSQALDVPFVAGSEPLRLRPSLVHGHYLGRAGIRNAVVVWRDGRDVMVSWYHMCCFVDAFPLGQTIRKQLPFTNYDDVRGNLPAFIEFVATRRAYPGFSWAQFVRRWHDRPGVAYVRYEDMQRDTSAALQRLVLDLTGRTLDPQRAAEIASAFSFRTTSGRAPGQEDKTKFHRKGLPGDWRANFTDAASATFQKFAGTELALLGYR